LNPAARRNTHICETLENVGRRNITFNLPEDLLRSAKMYAAEHDTTVNSLVRQLLREKLDGEAQVRAAANRFLAVAEKGPYFTTDPGSIRRDELHER